MTAGPPRYAELRAGAKPVVARALAAIETHAEDPALVELLDAAWEAPRGHVIGITGPPGVGKSSLINALIGLWRAQGLSVAVVAVDPSSRQSGGALLGDRTRIIADPEDDQVFIRSMAARDRLGGLADITFPAVVLLRAVYDRVIVETVGVGQSETEIVDLADTVVFCVQPGSGDALQFMKAGIVEVPHIAVVTKADMGRVAERAKADLEGALGLAVEAETDGTAAVVLVSVQSRSGLDTLVTAIDAHWATLARADGRGLAAHRTAQARLFLSRTIRDRFGREGLAWAERQDRLRGDAGASPFRIGRAVTDALLARLG